MTCKNLNDPKIYGQYKKTMHHFGLDFGGKAGRLLGLQILKGTNRCKTIHKTNVYFFFFLSWFLQPLAICGYPNSCHFHFLTTKTHKQIISWTPRRALTWWLGPFVLISDFITMTSPLKNRTLLQFFFFGTKTA